MFGALLVSAAAAADTNRAVVLEVRVPWPRRTRWLRELSDAAERVSRQTGGRARIDLQRGSVLHEVVECRGHALPLKVCSCDERNHLHAALDPLLESGLKRKGYVPLGVEGLGLVYVFSTREIRCPPDLVTGKVWVPEESLQQRVTRLGLENAVAVPPRGVRRALRDGEIDTVIVPPLAVIAGRWRSALSAVLDLPFSYACVALAVPRGPFEQLSEADRSVVRRILTKAFSEVAADNREKNREAMAILRSERSRLAFITPNEDERRAWHEWADATACRLVSDGHVSGDIAAALDRCLAECRPGVTNAMDRATAGTRGGSPGEAEH